MIKESLLRRDSRYARSVTYHKMKNIKQHIRYLTLRIIQFVSFDHSVLFNNELRTDDSQIKRNESEYNYLLRAKGHYPEKVRDNFNKLFQKLKSQSKIDVKSKLPKQYYSTFFELLIHDLFWSLGYSLIEHPEVKNLKTKPDFLASNCGEKIFIEATTFDDQNPRKEALQNVENQILTKLQSIKGKYYLYKIDHLILKSKSSPNLKNLYKDFESKLNTPVPTAKGKSLSHTVFIVSQNDNDIDIKIKLVPKSTEDWGIEQDELLGTMTSIPRTMFDETRLVKALKIKMKKYGKTENPLIICINITSHWFFKKPIFDKILFGSVIKENNEGPTQRDGKGIFKNESYSYVDGVLFMSIFPYILGKNEYYYYKNPASKYKLKFSTSLNTYELEKARAIKKNKGKEIIDILYNIK